MQYLRLIAALFFSPILALAEGEARLPESDGSSLSLAEALGDSPNLHRSFTAVLQRPNRRPILTSGTADENGIRLSPASNLPGKSKHLLLLGGGGIFGARLSDEETVSNFVNERSLDYEAYPIANLGFGPQHAWMRFEHRKLPKQIKYHRGRAILVADENTLQILFGSAAALSSGVLPPHLSEDANGKFRILGNFAGSGSLWQRALVKLCLPADWCKRRMRLAQSELTLEQLEFAGRLLDDIETRYRSQFDVEDFQVLWTGNFYVLDALRKFTKAKITLAPSFPAGDLGYYNGAMSRKFADFLFTQKLIGGRERLRALTPIPTDTSPVSGATEIRLNEALGKVPNWHREFEHIKAYFGGEKNGEPQEITRVSADEHGFRVGPASHGAGKSRHFFLIGSSEIYGEGLSSAETITNLVNKRSDLYEAYPLAFFGWGVQHAWVRFKDRSLPKQVPFSRGRAVLELTEASIARLFGDPKTLLFGGYFPLLKEGAEGKFEMHGSFGLAGSWWQRAQLDYCNPIYLCQSLVAMQPWKPNVSHLRTMGKLLDEIDQLYRSQFKVEDFSILWSGSEEVMAALRPLTQVKITALPYIPLTELGEPNAEGAKKFTDFLFDQQLVE